MKRVLIADDEPNIVTALEFLLQRSGYEVLLAQDGEAALKQIVKQGRDRLEQGFWIVIFPEGTRIAPGEKGKYGIGGAWLATHTSAPVVPVAHNAGEFWSRNAFVKLPGTITVSIGAPIDSTGMEPGELNAKVETWIEAEMVRIGSRETSHSHSAGEDR